MSDAIRLSYVHLLKASGDASGDPREAISWRERYAQEDGYDILLEGDRVYIRGKRETVIVPWGAVQFSVAALEDVPQVSVQDALREGTGVPPGLLSTSTSTATGRKWLAEQRAKAKAQGGTGDADG